MNRLLPLLVAAALSLSACGGASPAAESATVAPVNLPAAEAVSETESCAYLYGNNKDGPLFVTIDAMAELTNGEDPSEQLNSKIRVVSGDLDKISSNAGQEIKRHIDLMNEAFRAYLPKIGKSHNVEVESFKAGAQELLDKCGRILKAHAASKATPSIAEYALTCRADGKSDVAFSSYKEAWASGKAVDSCSGTLSAGTPSALETELGVEAHGSQVTPHSEIRLNAVCAYTAGAYVDALPNDSEAPWARAAMKLCPDHPKRAQIEATLAMFEADAAKRAADIVAAAAKKEAEAAKKEAAAAELEARKADKAAGKLVGPGKYLVGTEVQPGVWQSQGAKVEDCYWETSDASGNILENNFISIAPQFTIRIPAGAAGFTASNCSFRWISG